MDTLQEKLQEWLVPIATKLSEAKLLRAISSGFSMLLPVIMIGAFASLFSGLNIEAYQNFVASTGLKTIFAYITTYTTNMIAVYAAFSIARSFAQQLGADDQANLIGLTTLMIFFMMIPTGVGQGDAAVAAAISTTYFGSSGLFTAIILGLVVPAIYVQFIRHNVTIKMPEGVPPMVEQGFAALIPALCLAALFVAVRQLCLLTPFGTLNDLIYGLLRAPLAALNQSPLTFGILVFICNLLWFFGIHGGMVTMPFLSLLYMQPALENLDAYAAGATVMPNILTNTWWFTFVQLGGSGGIIGLALCMLLFAKSDRYKTLGKLAIVPALCSISEPVVFGFPLMLNAIMFIPMILTPLFSFVLSYAVTAAGIIPALNGIQLGTGTPVLLSGLLAGGVPALVWQAVIVALQFAIYLPFFRICDKQAVEEESAEASAEA